MKKYVTDIKNNIYVKEENTINNNTNASEIMINPNKVISQFLGFGSAITESSSFNYQKLSKQNKINFISDYYSKDGLNYNFGRISIGSNDFAIKSFSYAKKRNLIDFSISHDQELVIPFLKDILNKKKISLIASPWSPPRMYKRLPILYFGIKLRKKYYDNYSNYLIKFIEEYKRFGINIDYITMQNEPMARQRFESCKFNLQEQKKFIYSYLLPKLDFTRLLLWDHNKDDLFNITNELYCDNPKIAGVAFHYYTGHCFDELKKIRDKYPKLLLINTEMCSGYSNYNEKSWIKDAEYYLTDIIGDMNCGINAYLDWNVLLDQNGGPTHSKNYVKSSSILKNDAYIKSPIYYYIYHISHFLGKNNYIIESKTSNKELKIVSLKCDSKIVIIIMNNTNQNINYSLIYKQEKINDNIKAHTILTYVM